MTLRLRHTALAVVVLAVALSACGAAEPTPPSSVEGSVGDEPRNAAAGGVPDGGRSDADVAGAGLLRPEDLPAGFEATSQDDVVRDNLARCVDVALPAPRLRRGSPVYQLATDAATRMIGSYTDVHPSEAAASRAFGLLVPRAVQRCVVENAIAESAATEDAYIRIVRGRVAPLHAPTLPTDEARGWRATYAADGPGDGPRFPMVADLWFLRDGRTVVMLAAVGFPSPMDPDVVASTLGVLAERTHAASRAAR